MIYRVKLQDIAPQPWRNGGGSTQELLTWPVHQGGAANSEAPWQMRISVAQIDRGGPFSAFPGVQRWFAVMQGAGVDLMLGEQSLAGQTHRLTPLSAPLCFDGGLAPRCTLIDGPTQDLNLMLRADAGQGGMARVIANVAWTDPAPLRALFTLDALTLFVDGALAFTLPAATLAYDPTAGHQGWQVQAHGATPRAWWLHFHPNAAR